MPENCLRCSYRGLRMFCNFDSETLQAFDSIGIEMRYPARVPIYSEGEPARSVFVLCSGQVKLSAGSRSGRSMILKIAMPGDVLGLSAILTATEYEVTAETLEPCQLKSMRRQEFLDFLSRYGVANTHALEKMAADYQAAFVDARRLALSGSAAGRLAHLLLDWAHSAACSTPELRFTLALTHEEIGEMAGMTRETVTRLLSRFQREKTIEIHGATVLIKAPARLEKVAD